MIKLFLNPFRPGHLLFNITFHAIRARCIENKLAKLKADQKSFIYNLNSKCLIAKSEALAARKDYISHCYSIGKTPYFISQTNNCH